MSYILSKYPNFAIVIIFSMTKERVLVAMSGGVDSSVAAILLHQQGFDVVGVTMKTWEYASTHHNGKETGCCNLDSFNDARMIAVDYGFPHYILDLREQFTGAVIDDFVDEYLNGNTPNPCIMCNTHIKWKVLLEKAEQLQCKFIATGHYAKVAREGNRLFIRRGVDTTKDQSYVLWGLNQTVLAKTLFPIAEYNKTEIRTMLIEWGYDHLAQKKDSYEICFIPNNDYRSFLKTKVDAFDSTIKQGNFINKMGEVIGNHEGYPFYTVGQRKGLGTAFGKRQFVLSVNPAQNEVMLGNEEELLGETMWVKNVNWQKRERMDINESLRVMTKIRYKDVGTPSLIVASATDKVQVEFLEPVKGITPGQSAVFYEGDDIVGGGIITKRF